MAAVCGPKGTVKPALITVFAAVRLASLERRRAKSKNPAFVG